MTFLSVAFTFSLGSAALLTLLEGALGLYRFLQEAQQDNYYNAGLEAFVKLVGNADGFLLLIAFGLNILYIIFGIIRLLRRGKAKKGPALAKGVIRRGVMGAAACWLMYFVLELILSLPSFRIDAI